MAGEYRHASNEVELAVLRYLLDPTLYTQATFWLRTGARSKVIHRLFLLTALRLILDESFAQGTQREEDPLPHRTGELLLKLNDVLDPDYAKQSRRASPAGLQDLVLAALFRYGFFYQSDNLGSAIGRSWAFYEVGLDEATKVLGESGFDFRTVFESSFGFTVREMLALGFAFLGRYRKEPEDLMRDPASFAIGPSYYRQLTERMRTLVPIMLTQLGRTWGEHSAAMTAAAKDAPDNLLQVFSLYDHPLLSLDGSEYFMIDRDFLEAAVVDGPFWKLAGLLIEENKGEYPRLLAAHAKAFEWYVARLLEDYATVDGVRVAWTEWFGTLKRLETRKSVDALVRDGSTLYFIEITTSGISPKVAVSGEWNGIENKLSDVWFSEEKGKGRGKLRQIAKAIDAFKEGALKVEGLSLSEIEHYVPVLVTLRHLPQHKMLRVRYRELWAKNGLPEDFISRATLLDIGELECLLGGVGGVQGWNRVFEDAKTLQIGSGSMNDYLVAKGLDKTRPARLEAWTREAGEVFHSLLFPPGSASEQ